MLNQITAALGIPRAESEPKGLGMTAPFFATVDLVNALEQETCATFTGLATPNAQASSIARSGDRARIRHELNLWPEIEYCRTSNVQSTFTTRLNTQ